MENIEYLKKVHNITKKMSWGPSEVYRKLEIEFNKREGFDFPIYNTFTKQYNLKGKGSRKNFKDYFEYLYGLDEVKNKLSEPQSKIKANLVALGLVLIILSMSLFASYDPDNKLDVIKTEEYKECARECLRKNKYFTIGNESIFKLENYF